MSSLASLAVPGTLISVRVTPGASRDSLDFRDGTVCIRVTAPPEDGKATEAARVLLAKALGIAKTRLLLKSGATSRNKRFEVQP
ncbi:MAG: DUF167 domain-containing protein [Rhodobacteraceae bacterium]|nr:DUF167 domain-containing protein [Paracoccaceae bacterium]